ncbi:hypothetical protein CIPAW_15G142000 [Carya illinoinensis]|uniref:Transmembrane protein n=1 Tax=Carya illinoinensis TaxID=32201 RepID=A0A8T1N7C8_CARIL|nr:hypothetical protein CIPAW_15G142000 [Carya illinoinensis]
MISQPKHSTNPGDLLGLSLNQLLLRTVWNIGFIHFSFSVCSCFILVYHLGSATFIKRLQLKGTTSTETKLDLQVVQNLLLKRLQIGIPHPYIISSSSLVLPIHINQLYPFLNTAYMI